MGSLRVELSESGAEVMSGSDEIRLMTGTGAELADSVIRGCHDR